MADYIEKKKKEDERKEILPVQYFWDPQKAWVKCNIGIHCSASRAIGGASWVLRDANGKWKHFDFTAGFNYGVVHVSKGYNITHSNIEIFICRSQRFECFALFELTNLDYTI